MRREARHRRGEEAMCPGPPEMYDEVVEFTKDDYDKIKEQLPPKYRVEDFDENEMGWSVMTGQPGTAEEHMIAWVPDILGPTDERKAMAHRIADTLNETTNLEGKAQRQALSETADAWQQGEWINAPRRADRVLERLATAQYVTDWLRSRAARYDA